MSTIKVNSIKNTSTDDGGIAIDNSGHVQIDGQQLPTAGALSSRNMVDNGAMVIAQRGTSESGLTDSPAFVVDRFSYRRSGAWGTNSFTMSQQSSGAPGGFTHFLRLAQSGTAAAPPSDAFCSLNTGLEGFNVAQAGFGTSSAKDVTLSFYAKVSQAGTYCVNLANGSANQHYVVEFSLTSSWARYEATIPARTTGTWTVDNTRAMELQFIVSADSDSTIHSGSTGWNTSADRYTSNQTEAFASNSGATFDLCGVQLEVGGKSTSYEHEPYSVTLAKCQRYFQQFGRDAAGTDRIIGSGNNSTTPLFGFRFPYIMRATPTLNYYGGNVDGGNFQVHCPGETSTSQTAPGAVAGAKSVRFNFSGQSGGATKPHFIDLGTGANQFGFTADADF